MLKLNFFNVGDGDSIYVEDTAAPFHLLVDAGREDCAIPCAAHLARLGVKHLDALVITHLHSDHFFGLRELMKTVDIRRVYATFFPAGNTRTREWSTDGKTVRGMRQCLNRWSEDTALLRAHGTALCTLTHRTTLLPLTKELCGCARLSDTNAMNLQRRVWERMLLGEDPDEALMIAAAKLRNATSLRLELSYAGRCIVLAGDCYGLMWEDEAQKCDLLKVPHHGDKKAVTPTLAARTHPQWAVVSCEDAYIPRKDRPSAQMASLLHAQGARLWYTGRARESVDFCIAQDGSVLLPREGEE